jgi:hypothetical protein
VTVETAEPFPLERQPLSDWTSESARTQAYWSWLEAKAASVRDGSLDVAHAFGGGRWVRLSSAGDADYEAKHIRHSIGHSWDRYSKIGEIYSLRDEDNLPLATVLVQDVAGAKVVVHAREHENARLSVANMAALEAFAESRDYRISQEPLPFDFFDDDGPSTAVKYFHRAPDGAKTFSTVVLGGRLTRQQATQMAATLADGRLFDPRRVGLASLRHGTGHDPADHEIVTVFHTQAPPTGLMTGDALHAAWSAAAQADWFRTQGHPKP